MNAGDIHGVVQRKGKGRLQNYLICKYVAICGIIFS